MKVLVLGYSRHGKDTFATLLGIPYTSSSMIACERIVFPELAPKYGYKDALTCYENRHEHRSEWFECISRYCTPDKSKLTKEILKDYHVYVGMRNKEELDASKHLFDLIIWVDASDRLLPEDKMSCTVTKSDADMIVNNNGSLEDLKRITKILQLSFI